MMQWKTRTENIYSFSSDENTDRNVFKHCTKKETLKSKLFILKEMWYLQTFLGSKRFISHMLAFKKYQTKLTYTLDDNG